MEARQQQTVAKSSTEAEHFAAGAATCEAIYLQQLEHFFTGDCDSVSMSIDNRPALDLINNPLSSNRTNHIDVTHHHIRERVELGLLEFNWVSSKDNLADIFTKPLPRDHFCCLRSKLGVRRNDCPQE